MADRRYSRAAASEQFGSIACRRWCDFEVANVSIGTAALTHFSSTTTEHDLRSSASAWHARRRWGISLHRA